MEPLQRTPSKITNTHLNLHKFLYEIDAQIIQFTNLPIHTPALDLLSQDIIRKLGFIRNYLTTETVSHKSFPHHLVEIEHKLVDLEAEFYQSNLRSVDVDHEDDDDGGSVCESCLNDDRDFEEEAVSDVWSVREGSEVFCEYDVTVPEKVEETTSSDWKKEKTGRRWWWRTVVILMTASVVIMAMSYFEKKQQEEFLIPT